MSTIRLNKGLYREKKMKDKHIVALLKIQLEHDLRIKKLDEALNLLGANCDTYEIFPLDLLDIVADLLGVPQDNYDDLPANHHGGPNGAPKEYYSRDWVWDRWLECGELEDPISSFVDTMKGDIEQYYKENE